MVLVMRLIYVSPNCSGNASLNAVAMALAGYSEDRNASLWRRTCSTQRYQLSNPYLRAIFAFLACDNDYYSDVLVRKINVIWRETFYEVKSVTMTLGQACFLLETQVQPEWGLTGDG